MEQLMVTVLFDGRWNTEKRFLAHSTHGLLLEVDGSYSNLLFALREMLNLGNDVDIKAISYQIDKAFHPTTI
ncbi:unnamed protein product, partial [Cuscuta epithymum]